ncbi:MAG: YgiQ family radical SAM protein [Thermodesulfobacteriota bacterium]
MAFLPATKKEMNERGWDFLDVILITGDAYIDSPYCGVAVIGKVLAAAGFRTGIIAQPDMDSDRDIARLGEPSLFWGVTAGSMDSMVANYTATKKFRKTDDMTPGGKNTRRPDRASIVYTNLIRRYFKNTKPIVLGGIEAGLRRISHYDFWSDAVRRSILFDAKADLLVYGMGEKAVVEIARRLASGLPAEGIRGTCHAGSHALEGYTLLPSHDAVCRDKEAFARMFDTFYHNNDPLTASGLCQRQDTRFLIHHPPQSPPDTNELDRIHEMDYQREAHPCHASEGPVRALETIRFSITTHRGCYGECRFCAIAVHQGRTIIERSEASILREAQAMTRHPRFKGIIQDVGGPTANMYGIECDVKRKKGICRHKRCLAPRICKNLPVNHMRQLGLLQRLRGVKGVRKVFIGSGIRHDMILHDRKWGQRYLEEIVSHHVSGQLKIAPEHSEDPILSLMGKPDIKQTTDFISRFTKATRKSGKNQYLTCYFIAAHPGCTMEDMRRLKSFAKSTLGFVPEQVQIFTPAPSTFSTLMYYTERDCDTGKTVYVEKDRVKKEKQKQILQEG